MKKLIIILLLSIPVLGYGQAKYLKIGIDTAATRDWSRAYLKLFNPYLLDSSWIKGNIRDIITNGTGALGLPNNTTGQTVILGLTSNNIPILFTGVDNASGSGSQVQLANDILRFNVEKYTPYLSKPTGLGLYVSSETPTGTLPLKLNGNFYSTKLFASDIEIQGKIFPTTNSPLNIYTESLANNDFILYSSANTRWENKTVYNVLNLLIPDQTGNANKILKTNGTSLLWGAETSLTNGLLEFSGSTFAPYAAFSANNFYLGTTNPTGTTRLNIDRNLYATKVYSGGTEILPHNPITIGTANGLSLSTQALSLGLSSTSTTGALSNTDWNTFNNKVTFPGFGTTVTTAANGNHLHTGVYQPLLVSGTNIKSINGVSIVGSGDVTISTSGIETDPIFTAHAANGITASNITNWTNKVSFPGFGNSVSTAAYGNHVHGNYLPFYTGTTNPTGTTRYNVDGNLYATSLITRSTQSGQSGVFSTSTAAPAVYGFGNYTNGEGVFGYAPDKGIGVSGLAQGAGSIGVKGESSISTGVYGVSNSGVGIRGSSDSGIGIFGISASGISAQFMQNMPSTGPIVEIIRINGNTSNITASMLAITDSPTTTGTVTNPTLTNSVDGIERISFNPRIPNGATATAYFTDTKNNLTTPGAKLWSFRNFAVEKAHIDKDGKYKVKLGATEVAYGGALKTIYTDVSAINGQYMHIYPPVFLDGILNKDGDYIEMEAMALGNFFNGQLKILIGSTNTTVDGLYWASGVSFSIAKIKQTLIRTSSTAARLITENYLDDSGGVRYSVKDYPIDWGGLYVQLIGNAESGTFINKYFTIKYFPAGAN